MVQRQALTMAALVVAALVLSVAEIAQPTQSQIQAVAAAELLPVVPVMEQAVVPEL